MPNINLTTYHDLVGHVIDYFGAGAGELEERMARRAVQNAYRAVATARTWTYYYQRGRIVTSAAYSTGTVAYDHTGGTYERQLTLTTGTWPSWAAFGSVLISNVEYEVATRESDSVITLTSGSNPGADVASGTTYEIIRDTYPMPGDFSAADEMMIMAYTTSLDYVHPSCWLQNKRIVSGTGLPRYWTVTSDPNYFGVLACRFYQPPDAAYNVDFIYRRKPRQLRVQNYNTGTASVTAESATLTGSGTSWTSSHVGAVVRFYDDSQNEPTSIYEEYPAVMERTITAYTSATSLTLDAVADQTLSGVKYTISDPVDIEEGAMLNYLFRECEKQARAIRRMKPTEEENALYQEAMWKAFEADARSLERRVSGASKDRVWDMADMPYDSTT